MKAVSSVPHAASIRRPTDGSHWSAPDHVFGEATVVGMSESKSDHEYNYKAGFKIWKENQEFERQKISMSQPPLDSTTIGTNTTKVNHLWTQLLLAQTQQKKNHFWT